MIRYRSSLENVSFEFKQQEDSEEMSSSGSSTGSGSSDGCGSSESNQK